MNLPSEDTKVIFRDFDPGGTVAESVNPGVWIDMSGYHKLMVIAFRTVGSGAAALKIQVASDTSGTGAADVGTAVGTTSATGLLNAASTGSIGNPGCGMMVAECHYEDLAVALENGRYINAIMEQTTAGDEFGVAFIFSEPRYTAGGLTVTGGSV